MEAKALLDEYNSTAEEVWNAYTEASWSYNTDINEANKEAMVSQSDETSLSQCVSTGTSISDGPALFILTDSKAVAI